MPNFLRKIDWRVAAALAATYLFFGSGPAAAAAGIKSLPPFLMVACRGLIAGLVLIVWALAEGAPRPSWREWRGSAIIGVLILACGAGGGTYGQLTVPSGVAGVLSALLPLIAAVMGYILFRERLPIKAVIGPDRRVRRDRAASTPRIRVRRFRCGSHLRRPDRLGHRR